MDLKWIELDWCPDPDDGDWVDLFDEHNESLVEAAWKVGNLIRAKNGTIHLVGTVNRQGGTCGCCNIPRYDAVAYATPYPELSALLERNPAEGGFRHA